MSNRFSFPVMGTVASVVVSAPTTSAAAARAVQAARASLQGDEARFSHYRFDSDIERRMRGEPVGAEAAAEIELVLQRCRELHELSGGSFTAARERVDTAGYVKGYAIGKAVAAVRATGISDFTVNVGGDSYSAGRPNAARPWRVAVVDPASPRPAAPRILAVVDATDLAVATSGTAERGSHIWRADGSAAGGDLLSLTVTGPDIALADAFATAAFAMGRAGVGWVQDQPGYRALAVTRGGERLGSLQPSYRKVPTRFPTA